MNKYLLLSFLSLGFAARSADAATDDGKRMFDSMENLMSGADSFDQTLYDEMWDCMAEYDLNLPKSQDAAWAGMIRYFDENESMNDTWGAGHGHWHEMNNTLQAFHNIMIMEPCNYASNIAYYRVAAQICQHRGKWNAEPEYVKAMVQGFVALGMGSSFMHGSETHLGSTVDVRFIDVVAFIAHQASLRPLNSDSAILMDLNNTAREQNSLDIAEELTKIFVDKPVQEWKESIDGMDIPDFMNSFAGLITTFMTLIFEDGLVDVLGPFLMETMQVPEDIQNFILSEYVPELRAELSGLNLTEAELETLTNNGIGTFTKLLYAFLWQEEWFPQPIFLDPFMNILGATMIKYVNNFANGLTTFPTYDMVIQNGTSAYPGSEWCNDKEPHAKWHLESANGLMDLVYLADHINMLLKQKL